MPTDQPYTILRYTAETHRFEVYGGRVALTSAGALEQCSPGPGKYIVTAVDGTARTFTVTRPTTPNTIKDTTNS